MALNVVLVPQRQSPDGIALSWSPMEGVASYQIFVATRKMSSEELEAAQLLGGTEDCFFAKVGGEVHSVVDDITAPGEARYYGVAMVFDDGTVKAARFKAVPDGGSEESFQLSIVRNRASKTGTFRIAAPPGLTAPAIAPPPRTAVAPRNPAPAAAAPRAEEDPLEARKRAQREARERSSRDSAAAPEAGASAEPPPQPASIPLAERLEARMQGATQTWDGLRIYWEKDPRAAAYEVIASDHQIFADELADALAGNADFTTAVAVAPSVTAVIDNVTARESRGWYLVLVRSRDGERAAHPFKVGDAADSGRTVAPFLNPNRTGELRGEVEDLVAQAQEQWDRWNSEQDVGARREAKRLVGDALLIWPGHPAAKKLEAQMAG